MSQRLVRVPSLAGLLLRPAAGRPWAASPCGKGEGKGFWRPPVSPPWPGLACPSAHEGMSVFLRGEHLSGAQPQTAAERGCCLPDPAAPVSYPGQVAAAVGGAQWVRSPQGCQKPHEAEKMGGSLLSISKIPGETQQGLL